PSSTPAPRNTATISKKIGLTPLSAVVGRVSGLFVIEDLHHRLTALFEAATIHARRIETPDGVAVTIHHDDATIAMNGVKFAENFLRRFLGAFVAKLHARADVAGDADADEILAGARSADAANTVLRVSASADDG